MQVTQCELLVVGAGPAGLSAAATAAALGVDTVLLDEQPAPGGQIYRAITTTPVTDRRILGDDYWHGASLLEPFKASGARHEPGATVWSVSRMTAPDPEESFEVGYSVGGEARLLHARHILLATGAQERPFPIPGWTLPGVVTAGAGQILLKSAGLVPGGRAILAGCGPLLYLIAWQYLNAGVKIDRILETTPPGRLKQALPHVFDFLRSPRSITLARPLPSSKSIMLGPAGSLSRRNVAAPRCGFPSMFTSTSGVKLTRLSRTLNTPRCSGPIARRMPLSASLPTRCVPGSSQCRPTRLVQPSGRLRSMMRFARHRYCSRANALASACARAASSSGVGPDGVCAQADKARTDANSRGTNFSVRAGTIDRSPPG